MPMFGQKALLVSCFAFWTFGTLPVCGEVFTADFLAGTGTNGWTFSDRGWANDYGRKLDRGDFITSPAFDQGVTNVSLTTRGANFVGASTNSPSVVVWTGPSLESLAPVATNWFISGAETNWSLSFPPDLDCRVFRFVFVKTRGNLGIESVTAVYGAWTPPPAPEPVPSVLAAVPMSSRHYAQDFDSLDPAAGGGPWTNCVAPLACWQAYVGTNAATAVAPNAGTTQIAGLYALRSNDLASSSARALGSYAAGDKDVVYGLAFTNDTSLAQSRFAVSFTAGQWGFKNKLRQTLFFQFLVTNALVAVNAPGDWRAAPALAFVTPFTSNDVGAAFVAEPKAGPLPVVIAPGDVLVLRWQDLDPSDGQGKDACTGIDDFRLEWSPKFPGFSFHVR